MEARRLKPRDKNWLRQRKSVLRKIKDQVRLYLGPEPDDLRRYAKSYQRDIERPWEPSTFSAVHQAVEQAQVVFGGDFHSFPQSQRAHLRILRQLQKKSETALALEIFTPDQQGAVDQFIDGSLSEEDFLEQIRWDETWGFPWSFYRPLIDFARQNQMPVVGINQIFSERTEHTLQARDTFAAEKVLEVLHREDVQRVYVVFGDLHIAETHLPRALEAASDGATISQVSIYLNPQKPYFDLAEQGLETQVDVVTFSPNQFALLSSPPWVKWQNYLMFLEENHDFGLDEDEGDGEVDYTDHVLNLVRMISSALEVKVDENDMEVYTAKDRLALDRTQDLLKKNQVSLAQFLLKTDRSFYLPSQGFFYLSKPSVNHVATLAAQYVHGKISKRVELLWDFPKDFVALVWVEAMGFFLSKFVNPKRKAQTMNDLKKQLSVFHPRDEGREPLLLALDQKMAELLEVFKGESRGQKYRPRKKSSYVEAARFLGPILGERYFNLWGKGQISRDQVLEILSFDPTQASVGEFYYKQLAELDRLESDVRDFQV